MNVSIIKLLGMAVLYPPKSVVLFAIKQQQMQKWHVYDNKVLVTFDGQKNIHK